MMGGSFLSRFAAAALGCLAMTTTSYAGESAALVAQAGVASPGMQLAMQAVMAVVFGLIGIAFFGLFLFLIVKISPFSVRKEIEEDQNVALGIIVGAMILGIAMIISAALLG